MLRVLSLCPRLPREVANAHPWKPWLEHCTAQEKAPRGSVAQTEQLNKRGTGLSLARQQQGPLLRLWLSKPPLHRLQQGKLSWQKAPVEAEFSSCSLPGLSSPHCPARPPGGDTRPAHLFHGGKPDLQVAPLPGGQDSS